MIAKPLTVVLTGGPGAGKTSLAKELSDRGFAVMPESGRSVLQSPGGIALRERDPLGYAMAMLEKDITNLQMAKEETSVVVFDRGLADIVGYLNLMGIEVPQIMDEACANLRYSNLIFSTPPWAEIYVNDAERTQDFNLAKETYAAVTEAWRSYEYEPIELPKTSISKRADFIMDRLI